MISLCDTFYSADWAVERWQGGSGAGLYATEAQDRGLTILVAYKGKVAWAKVAAKPVL